MQHATPTRVLAVAAALTPALWALPAAAHAFLDHAVPAVGSTVKTAPGELELFYTEGVEPLFSTVAVTRGGAGGPAIATPKARVAPDNPAELIVTLPALTPGRYHVSWHVVAVDTHHTQGDFSFTVAP
jgi:methionine-rich copper-binding protein CopC